MARTGITYLVVSPPYDEGTGGVIFLHRLADELCRLGEDAVLWPPKRRAPRAGVGYTLKSLVKPYRMMPGTAARVARRRDLAGEAVAVYPEGIPGNPLGLANVARWIMYPPRLRHEPPKFSERELYFASSAFSDAPDVTGGAQLLHLFTPHPAYRQHNHGARSGTCYMLRKYRGPATLHDPAADTCLDGLDHAEIARHFNRCARFICYDEATMYSQFAALCGCQSVVVPSLFASRSDWVTARPIARYGVAHGLRDLEHADATRHLLAEDLARLEGEGRESVRAFVRRTRAEFFGI